MYTVELNDELPSTAGKIILYAPIDLEAYKPSLDAIDSSAEPKFIFSIVSVSPVSDQVNFPRPLSKPVIAADPTKFEPPSVLVRAKSTADCNLIVPVNTAELFVDAEPKVIDDVVLLYNWFKTVAVVVLLLELKSW